jgi:hypothetical protein
MRTMKRLDSPTARKRESSEQVLRALEERVALRGTNRTAAKAAPVLIELLEDGDPPAEPQAILRLLAQIAVGSPDDVACGGERHAAVLLEPLAGQAHAAKRKMALECEQAVACGAHVYLRWFANESSVARCAAAHLLAFVDPQSGEIDEALAVRAKDTDENVGVRSSALLAMGVRRTAHAEDWPHVQPTTDVEATILEGAIAFAALGSREPPLVEGAEGDAVEILARGVATRSPFPEPGGSRSFPWPALERMLLGSLARGRGRSARAQSALLRLLAAAAERGRAERVASALLVLSFGEPTGAAFSALRPSVEVFRGATSWSAEQRAVLRGIVDHDALWPQSAESAPSVRHVDACAIQIALKRMLEVAYYPSRMGVRTALGLVVSAGALDAKR